MQMRLRGFAGIVAAGVLLAGAVTTPRAEAAGPARPGDFNGDGKVDLVAGAPDVVINGVQAGGLAVFDGSRPPATLLTRDDLDTTGKPLGTVLASGDFDADGFADLAVGTPGESLEVDGFEESAVGAVIIVYGSASGLDTGRSQEFTQASPGVPGDPSQAEYFGGSLAAGDFDGDGRADLAIGSEGDQDGRQWSGSITVLRGGAGGLSTTNAQLVTNDVSAYEFGERLAAGDVDGDGVADLVQVAYMGTMSRIIAYRGGTGGLDTATALTKDLPGFSAVFSSSAMGDLNGDGRADIVAGDPEYASTTSGGRVAVVLSQGGTLADPQVITQDTPGVPDTDEPDDRFGWSLAIGDVDRDGYGDLAIGAPGETLEATGANGAGAVTVLRGSSAGIGSTGASLLTQDTTGMPDTAEVADLFGSAVSLHDHTGDGRADLAIGTPQEGVDGFTNAGQVTVLDGVRARTATAFDLSGMGVTDLSYAWFGSTLLP